MYLLIFSLLLLLLLSCFNSCPTLCDPIDVSPPGSPAPGILQARTLEWVAISFSNAWKWKVKGKSLSRVWLFTTPWTAAYQAPPSMGFSRRECWSGVPLPSPISHANQKNCSFKPTESDSMERGPRICPHLACSQMILKHTTEFSPASSLTFRRALWIIIQDVF